MQSPSLGGILRRDWPAKCLLMFATILTLIVMVAGGAVAIWGTKEPEALIIAGGAFLIAAIVCGGISFRRLCLVQRLLRDGYAAQGVVTRVGESIDEIGYAVVEYSHQGKLYRTRNVTHAAPERGRLVRGQKVEIVVDPTKPSRALIVKLFTGP